ncbi:MAG: hypothetical protein U0231_13770 [Nitrospiraceae bacterium]
MTRTRWTAHGKRACSTGVLTLGTATASDATILTFDIGGAQNFDEISSPTAAT